MALRNLPGWRALATQAGQLIGSTDPDVLRAILAQWTCEQTGTWPPTRNNPGNVARGWAEGVGLPYTVSMPNPQPSNPIVTYATPELGARAYGLGLARFSRYNRAIAAAHAGDGAAFLKAVTDAGYGTSYRCASSVYRSLGGTNTAPIAGGGGTGTGSSSGAPGAVGGIGGAAASRLGTIVAGRIVSVSSARTTGDCARPFPVLPSALDQWLGVYPIPPGLVGNPCAECAPGYNKAVVNPNVALPFVWVPADQLKPGQANGCARAGMKAGDRVGLSPDPSVLTDQLAGVLSGIPNAIGDVLRSTVLLVAILALALVGLWLLVGDRVSVDPADAAKLAKLAI